MHRKQCVVWFVADQKPGHRSQLDGLCQALSDYVDLEAHWLEFSGVWSCAYQLCCARQTLPTRKPDFIVAAGHRTHLPLLMLKHAVGAPVVVLMKPSLPVRWFDVCVVPEHDRPLLQPGIVTTLGVLNSVSTGKNADPQRGLILVGGPSKHYHWDDQAMVAQCLKLLAFYPSMRWTLTTSRRTPATFLEVLQDHLTEAHAQLTVVPVEKTNKAWLHEQFHQSGTIWVSEDSVSMVYESLTAGADVGLLPVSRRHANGRVARGVDQLIEKHLVTPLAECVERGAMYTSTQPFNEAERIAEWLLEHFGLWSDVLLSSDNTADNNKQDAVE